MSRITLMCHLHRDVKPNSVIQFPRTGDSYFVDEKGCRRKVIVTPSGVTLPVQKLSKKERRRLRYEKVDTNV